MNFRMEKTLRFWVDCAYESRKYEQPDRTRTDLIAEILGEYERQGTAMRCLDSFGRLSWRCTPKILRHLADAERDVEEDMKNED
jgi:predicted transcriptional regulator